LLGPLDLLTALMAGWLPKDKFKETSFIQTFKTFEKLHCRRRNNINKRCTHARDKHSM